MDQQSTLVQHELSRKIKCVVWDLDNTIWEGVLLEEASVKLRKGIVEIIMVLDSRGILQSIASRNEYTTAMDKLKQFGIDEYFLYPQINWNTKSSSIKAVIESINIGADAVAFVDDQPFERDEVKHILPEVLCIDAADLYEITDMPEMIPRFITEDSKMRRHMYRSDIERKMIEESFEGPQDEFLASLHMIFTVSNAKEGDLQRVEELTVRTHQLNTTGYTYSYDELDSFRKSEKYKLLVAGLEDKYGTYGKIGVALIECQEEVWTIKLLLMSCRVMSRGVGSIMIRHIVELARKEKVRLLAEFVSTERNRMMYITYKFAGFTEVSETGDKIIFEHDTSHTQPLPEYVKVQILD